MLAPGPGPEDRISGPFQSPLCALFPSDSRDISAGTLFWPQQAPSHACTGGRGPVAAPLARGNEDGPIPPESFSPEAVSSRRSCCCHPVLCTAPPHVPSKAWPALGAVRGALEPLGCGRTDRRTCASGVPAPRAPGLGSSCQAPCRGGRACARLSCRRSAHLLLPALQAWGRGTRSDDRACGLRLHSPRVLAAAKWH